MAASNGGMTNGHLNRLSNGGDSTEADNLAESELLEGAVCEDVTVAVAGRKNALRGQVWRARNGDYVRYRCVDDGSVYRPGGKVPRNSYEEEEDKFTTQKVALCGDGGGGGGQERGKRRRRTDGTV